MAETRRQRIDFLNAAGMTMVALIFDLIGLIPFVNIITGPIGWFILGLWLLLLGVGLFTVRRLATMGASLILEAVPFLSILPGLTVGILAIIIMVRLEDRGIALPVVGKK